MTMTMVPGVSAAEEHCLHEGAREFFERQGLGVLADFIRREGGNTLTGNFGALTEPAVLPGHARRMHCTVVDGKHWYY